VIISDTRLQRVEEEGNKQMKTTGGGEDKTEVKEELMTIKSKCDNVIFSFYSYIHIYDLRAVIA
jgi:hypothetical protein